MKSLMNHGSHESVRRCLVFGNVLAATLREKFRKTSEASKFLSKMLCRSKLMTKYKFKKMSRESTGISLGATKGSPNRRVKKSK